MNLDRHPDNHEAAMARADLYKLANYSMKLFKMIQEGQELEGWVQAKITKAADYIASVYHFMEYEMKASEYGETLENSDVYSESVRRAFEQKLMEAKKQAAKVKEGFDDLEKYMKEKDKPKPSGGSGKKQGKAYGGSKQKDDDKEKDVKEGFPTVADAKARHEKENGTGKFDKKKISTGTVYTRKADKDVEQDDEDTPKKNKKVKEGAKPDFLDMDKDGNKKEPMKKAVADKKKSPFAKKVEEDTRVAMRRGPGADMIRYEKDSPAPGAKKHRDDTAKAVKDLRASGQKLKKDDEKKVGDKTVDRYSRDDMSEGTGKCNHSAKGKKCPVHGLKECGGM